MEIFVLVYMYMFWCLSTSACIPQQICGGQRSSSGAVHLVLSKVSLLWYATANSKLAIPQASVNSAISKSSILLPKLRAPGTHSPHVPRSSRFTVRCSCLLGKLCTHWAVFSAKNVVLYLYFIFFKSWSWAQRDLDYSFE